MREKIRFVSSRTNVFLCRVHHVPFLRHGACHEAEEADVKLRLDVSPLRVCDNRDCANGSFALLFHLTNVSREVG